MLHTWDRLLFLFADVPELDTTIYIARCEEELVMRVSCYRINLVVRLNLRGWLLQIGVPYVDFCVFTATLHRTACEENLFIKVTPGKWLLQIQSVEANFRYRLLNIPQVNIPGTRACQVLLPDN